MGLAVVGNPNVNRRDIPNKVNGKTVFTYDINAAHIGLDPRQMIYMGFVRCPYTRATVTSIDTSKAEAAGYVTLTPDDFAPYNLLFVGSAQPHLPLSTDILYSGQPVVAVAAPTTDQVEDAISLVNVQYEVLPFVLDVEEALQPDAPQLFSGGNLPLGAINVENGQFTPANVRYSWGDADAAIASAAVVVGPVRMDTQVHQQAEMEPWAVVATWSGSGLTVYDSTEAPFLGQSTLAGYFQIPVNNVRVVGSGIPGVGASGFSGMTMGNKLGNAEHIIITAMMAKKAGATVKYGPTRSDHLAITSQRFSERAYLTMAASSDGTLTAIKGLVYENSGGWGGSNGVDTLSDIANMYMVPNLDISLVPVNTNTHNRSGAFRNVGESQGHYFMETVADMLAEKLNMDPAEFRIKNMRGATPSTRLDPTSGLPYTGLGQPETFINARDTFGWSNLWKGWGQASSVNGTVRTGVGLSLHSGAKGSPGASNVKVTVNPDGSVFINSGRTENGAGSDTAIPVMAAEALGLTSLDNFTYLHADTLLTTNDGVQGGSTSTRSSGLSTILAVENLKSQWAPLITKQLGVPSTDNLVFENNTIYPQGSPSTSISFKQAAALLPPGGVTGNGLGATSLPAGKVSYRVGGGKFAMVQVDTETAEVRVTQAAVGIDIGRVIFRKGADSQLRGGFIQGIGEALYEEFVNDPTTGQILNYDFHDFRVPTQADSPDTITSVWNEYVDPVGPYGAKGIGENCSMAVTPAITNALSNALGGYRFMKVPVTKPDIVAAIEWAQQNGKI